MEEIRSNAEVIMAKGSMTIETFTGMVKDALSRHMEGCSVETQETKKNNGVILHGICIREQESNIAPVIYMEGYFGEYQGGRAFSEIVAAVAENYRESCRISGFDIKSITDYERVKEKICFKVVNTDLNRELLSEVPNVPFCDLSVVFYVLLDSRQEQGVSFMINNRFMADWGVDTETLFERALHNTPRLLKGKVMPMLDILSGLLNGEDDGEECPLPDKESGGMYVATNGTHLNGASVFLYESLLSDFADRIGGDFYIIPSSVHELIFLPGDLDMGAEDIREMVSEVNATCLMPEEVLSDNVYRFRRETGLVEIA